MELGFEDTYWGIITYAPNPFALNKKLLMLTGCRRPGQYMLLNWLRNASESQPILSEVKAFLDEDSSSMRTLQIILKGSSVKMIESTKQAGRICRDWSSEPVTDPSSTNPNPRPFFFFPLGERREPDSQKQTERREPGPMSDLSLIIDIPHKEQWVQELRETLLDTSLESVFDPIWSSEVGLHVTVHEFLHTLGRDDQGPLRDLIHGKYGFKKTLEDRLARLPPIRLVARQATVTANSLHVLVDLHSKDTLASDRIRSCCDNATLGLKKHTELQETLKRFKAFPTPFPLHFTVASLHNRSGALQDTARMWAETHALKFWGELPDCQFSLTAAFFEPYNDIELAELTLVRHG